MGGTGARGAFASSDEESDWQPESRLIVASERAEVRSKSRVRRFIISSMSDRPIGPRRRKSEILKMTACCLAT